MKNSLALLHTNNRTIVHNKLTTSQKYPKLSLTKVGEDWILEGATIKGIYQNILDGILWQYELLNNMILSDTIKDKLIINTIKRTCNVITTDQNGIVVLITKQAIVEVELLTENSAPTIKNTVNADINKIIIEGASNQLVTTQSRNLFDKTKALSGTIVDPNTGISNAMSGFYMSNYIKIEPNTLYYKSTANNFAFYDSQKIYISGATSVLPISPSNAMYLRFNVPTANIDTFQLELGSVATPYTNFTVNTPSPIYPSKIENVGSSRNLIDNNNVGITAWGVTSVYNGDGSWTLNGTSTRADDFYLKGAYQVSDGKIPVLIDDVIYGYFEVLSGTASNNPSKNFSLLDGTVPSSNFIYMGGVTNGIGSNIATSTGNIGALRLTYPNATTFKDYRIRFWLSKNQVCPEYIPYSGFNIITKKTLNILRYNSNTWGGWTFVNATTNQNKLTISTVTTTRANANFVCRNIIKPNTKYALLYNLTDLSVDAGYVTLGGSATLVLKQVTGISKGVFVTGTTIANNNFYISDSGPVTASKTFKDIRIFELPTGSQIESDFNILTPSQLDIKYPFVSDDYNYTPNIINYNTTTLTEWTKDPGWSINNGSLVGTFISTDSYKYVSIPIFVKNNIKYGLLLNILSNTFTSTICLSSSGFTGTYPNFIVPGNTGYIKYVTISANPVTNQLFKIYQNAAGFNGSISLKDFRLFELPVGSQIESDFNTLAADQLNIKYPFIPVTESIKSIPTSINQTLRSLPNGVKDKLVIDKTSKTAWIERNVGTITSNGSEAQWSRNLCLDGIHYFFVLNSSNTSNDGTSQYCTISNFCSNPYGPSDYNKNSFWAYHTGVRIRMVSEPSLIDFKAMLALNPVTFNYQLATPTIENIDYPNVKTIQEITNISKTGITSNINIDALSLGIWNVPNPLDSATFSETPDYANFASFSETPTNYYEYEGF